MPEKTEENYNVALTKYVDYDSNRFHYSNYIKILDFIMLTNLFENGVSKGTIFVFDMKGVTLGHLAKHYPILLKKHIYYLQVIMLSTVNNLLHFSNR